MQHRQFRLLVELIVQRFQYLVNVPHPPLARHHSRNFAESYHFIFKMTANVILACYNQIIKQQFRQSESKYTKIFYAGADISYIMKKIQEIVGKTAERR